MPAFRPMVLTLCLALFAVSCANRSAMTSTPGTEPSLLEGTWTLNYITGPRIAFDGLYPREKPRIVFSASTPTEVGGHTSCNPFSAPVNIDNGAIHFGNIQATMMACEGEGEAVFVRTLKKIDVYEVDDTTLTLSMGKLAMMRFTKAAQ